MSDQQWSTQWLSSPGLYWFYGWCFKKCQKDEDPQLLFVEVKQSAGDSLFYVTRGHFLYKEEAYGVWQKVIALTFPEKVFMREAFEDYNFEVKMRLYQDFDAKNLLE